MIFTSAIPKMASQSSLFHPLTQIKAQAAKTVPPAPAVSQCVAAAYARGVKPVLCYQRRQ
jgi:hypothetical protein